MWRSFWGNAASSSASTLPLHIKLRLLQRATAPVLNFRASRWPPQKTIKVELDRTQRNMVGILLQCRPAPGEPPDVFFRRRARTAKLKCVAVGWWSSCWFKRAIAWDDHIRRLRNAQTWSASLVAWRGASWLQARRSERGASSLAGRTGTRALSGKVHVRWESGILHAKGQA